MQVKKTVVGLMSGTSLDGLDIACCEFMLEEESWQYSIQAAACEPYPEHLADRLRHAMSLSSVELLKLSNELGEWFGNHCDNFIKQTHLHPDFISSHGHTVFHQPENGMTLQIGSGACLATASRLPVVCDFRSADVALGGQGAPLVPIGDELLFGSHDACLNLGGFSNISMNRTGKRIAFDISPVNMALNELAGLAGLPYDAGGQMAAGGEVDAHLLTTLNNLQYYALPFPKSLGREWYLTAFRPHLEAASLSLNDKLATVAEHIALKIAGELEKWQVKDALITGGGAFNDDLIKRIGKHTSTYLKIPDNLIVQYKEALIFAFLGLLRWEGKVNTLSSVTGAKKDSCSGCIYLP